MLSRLPASAWIVTAILVCGTAVGFQAWQAWSHWAQWQTPLRLRTVAPPQKARVQPEIITQRHLFGREIQAKSEPVVPENLPETHLRLTLRGVADGSDSGIEGALIEGEDRRTEFYRIGESLPGGAVLKDVRPDSVVLDRSGRLETLSFPETASSGDDFVVVQYEEPVPAPNDAPASESETPAGHGTVEAEPSSLPEAQAIMQDPDAMATLPASAPQGSPVIDEKRRAEIREKLRKLKEQIQAQSR